MKNKYFKICLLASVASYFYSCNSNSDDIAPKNQVNTKSALIENGSNGYNNLSEGQTNINSFTSGIMLTSIKFDWNVKSQISYSLEILDSNNVSVAKATQTSTTARYVNFHLPTLLQGNYTAILTVIDSNNATETKTLSFVNPITNINSFTSSTIYPTIKFDWNVRTQNTYRLDIINSSNVVISSASQVNSRTRYVNYDLARLPKGTYTARLTVLDSYRNTTSQTLQFVK